MSYAEKRKKAAEVKRYPSMDVDMYLELKRGKFSWWDAAANGGKGERKESDKPIKGFFIGAGMMKRMYGPEIGANGGEVRSTTYFTNKDKITCFCRGLDKNFSGVVPFCDAYYSRYGKMGTRRIYYFLSENGIFMQITCNLSMSIDYENKDENNDMYGKMAEITPFILDPKNNDLSKRTLGFLNKVIKSNPPNHIKIVLGADITDEMADKYNLHHYADMFDMYKKHVTDGGEAEKPEEDSKSDDPADSFPDNVNGMEKLPDHESVSYKETDDLPF